MITIYIYVYKCYPIVVAEQIIDNNQEQKLNRIMPINNDKQSTSIIDRQPIFSHDQQTEKRSVVHSTAKGYQDSPKGKFGNSKTRHRSNTMGSK